MKKRFTIISCFIIMFISFIVIWDLSYKVGSEDAGINVPLQLSTQDKNTFLPSEYHVFDRAKFALAYTKMPVDEKYQRVIKNYYKNRSFFGAPPTIPHPITQEQNIGGKLCLQCHQNGGFVEKFNAYAPVTPHPYMISCKQCHISKNTSTAFRPTTYTPSLPPKIGKGENNALLGAPPIIPHQLQMRENCLSCHAGPAAVKELQVSHPERINCRQCHLPQQVGNTTSKPFVRKVTTHDK